MRSTQLGSERLFGAEEHKRLTPCLAGIAPPQKVSTAESHVSGHYERLAACYDELWIHCEGLKLWYTRQLMRRLDPARTHRVVDLAAGTGVYAAAMLDHRRFDHALCAVDPSPAMLAEVPAVPGIEPVLADAETFLSWGPMIDRVWMKDAVHHLPKRRHTFEVLHDRLPPGGRFVIVTPAGKEPCPLFAEARPQVAQTLPSPGRLALELREAGFTVSLNTRGYMVHVAKSHYFDMLRQRFVSCLERFSDRAIERGIAELDHRYKGRSVPCAHPSAFLTAVKTEGQTS